jgi:hypothetical protein
MTLTASHASGMLLNVADHKDKPVPWDEHCDQSWMKRVVAEFAREEDEDVVRFKGVCPRCKDDITVEIPRPPHYDVMTIEAPEEGGKATGDTARRPCNCGGKHTGRPTGTTDGCGVYGYAYAS